MDKHYQVVFITHLPSFYKINLYNAIAQKLRIFVIFVAEASDCRTSDFTQQKKQFDFVILNKCSFERRKVFKSCLQLREILKRIQFEKCVVGGWDLPEFWLTLALSPKAINCLALESSIFESRVSGIHKWIKVLFLKRISTIFYSGEPHFQLIERLGFKGKTYKTLGVGLTHYDEKKSINRQFKGRFLYVGRLSHEKNISLLIRVFQRLPDLKLTIIGGGPMQNELSQLIPDNIKLLGHIPYTELSKYYQEHDAFVLPSLREPWGLVVEEAIYYELPIVASKAVGASMDLVQAAQTGLLFDPNSEVSLTKAIHALIEKYALLQEKARSFDFRARDQYQVQAYVEALQ